MNVDIILENVYHSFRSVVNVQYAEDELPSIDELIGRLLAKPAGELDLLMDFTEQLDAMRAMAVYELKIVLEALDGFH